MAVTTNVPSDNFDDWRRDGQDLTKFVNQNSGSVTTRTGDNLTPLPVRDQQFQQALANVGYIYKDPDTFTTGSTLNGPNEALRRASDGEYFRRVQGPFPYTVAPNTDPTTDPLYVAVGSASLEDRLADVNSTQLVGGVAASAIAQSIKDKITISELIRGFGAAAWAQAVNYKTLVINQDVTKSGQYIVPAKQTIIFENNAAVTQADDLTAFIISNNECHIMGAGFILQSGLTLPTTYVASSRGILVTATAFDWSITGNIRPMWFKGAGFEADGNGILEGRTGYNQISGMHCDKNWDNYRFIAGFPAEYLTLSNCRSTNAANEVLYEETGNITWNGGVLGYGKGGIHLKHPDNGANPHHGSINGALINHSIDYQIWAEIVAAGFVFNGCTIYDNDDPSTGGIILDRCRGISIVNGIIGCNVFPITDGGFVGHVGYNRIAGNKIDRSRSIMTGVGFDRTKLFVEDNFDNNGDWFFNDTSKVYAQKRASASTALTGQGSYSLLGLGDEITDNRNALGASFVAPFRNSYAAYLETAIVCSSPFVNEYLWFGRDDSASGTYTELYRIKMVDLALGSTRAIVNFFYEFVVSSGGQINVFLSDCNPSATYTFSAGTLLTIKSNN